MSELKTFLQALQQSIAQQRFVKLVLSKYQGTEPDLQRIDIRQINLRHQAHLSFLYHYKTKDMTKNLLVGEGIAHIEQLLSVFKQANLLMQQQTLQLSFTKKNKPLLLSNVVPTTATSASNSHNRDKTRLISPESPFWIDLGIVDANQQLIPAMSKKWKQINKFIEIFAKALKDAAIEASQEPLHIVDFGAGKGYLTFAIHDYLHRVLNHQAQVTGVELRDSLVQLCNQAIARCQLLGLQFYQGDVQRYQPTKTDVMIALHACDTATDYAIHTGIRLGAKIIMCAPCCHKQLRPQMQSPHILQPVLQHGIHFGQEAEMITDGLRALLLEACGYQTQVFEFVSLEHTSKNKMILAIKKQVTPLRKQEILAQIRDIKNFYGITTHCLEELLTSG